MLTNFEKTFFALEAKKNDTVFEAIKERIQELQNNINNYSQQEIPMNEENSFLKKDIENIQNTESKEKEEEYDPFYDYFYGYRTIEKEISILQMKIGLIQNRLKLNKDNIKAMEIEIEILERIFQGTYHQEHYQLLEQTKDYSFHAYIGSYHAKEEKSKFFTTYQKELQQLVDIKKVESSAKKSNEPNYPDIDPHNLYPGLEYDENQYWLRK